jgi:propionyl-CoA carboxylase alpha chain
VFGKILIANRGEVACRIIRTAKRMGLSTVAVYSDADRDALHVEMADEAVRIGPAPAAQSYLSIAAILTACRESGADAVHPGYGFLSERPAFAIALKEAGIVFIGPNTHAIEAMGDKIESKKFASAANVTTVPGYLGAVDNPATAETIANEIGYPVMIKASAGGGGKGMRIAHAASEVAEGFARARSEAKASFGDDRVFVEKFIVNPRHIEIQVLGDKHGNVIHLGERECSLQRRNQKVVEEAPSPLLDEATRNEMGRQAVALAKAVDYDSAGTVEFVVGQDRSFYFLEMNTRLQVEHPVTEFVTGLDLVEQMIRVAAGEKLAFTQAEVRLKGWAIETRVYAEDPSRGFLPSIGRLVKYRPPGENAGNGDGAAVRVDSGVVEGGEISIHYDPMIAKLVTHAPTRAQAIAAQAQALDAFVVDGIRHNIAFLSAVMAHSRWREGRLSTGFIAEEFGAGFAPPLPEGAMAEAFAAVAAHVDDTLNRRKRAISGQMRESKNFHFERTRVVMLGGLRVDCDLENATNGLWVNWEDGRRSFVTGDWRPGATLWQGRIDARPLAVQVRPILNGFTLNHGGCEAQARVYTLREAELASLMRRGAQAQDSGALVCPMPGLVKSIDVAIGQDVKAGEVLCVIEAMKMENALVAERDAKVKTILAREGDSLAVDAVIMEFA